MIKFIKNEFLTFNNKFQVVAAKGDNIIAVTNPALMTSPTLPPPSTGISLKKECLSPIDLTEN